MNELNTATKTKNGHRVKQNYHKTGKKAARKESRRQEAVARQIRRLTSLQAAFDKNENKRAVIKVGKESFTTQELEVAVVKAKQTLKDVQGKQPVVVKRY